MSEEIRLLLGLSADVVSDDTLEAAEGAALDWCTIRAAAYKVAPPQSAVAMMTLFFLRQNLDIRGIKPSSISMPDLSMATDLRGACELLKATAVEEIKAAAFSKGQGFKHIRSGKVPRWSP
jgi:hypothetical protein